MRALIKIKFIVLAIIYSQLAIIKVKNVGITIAS